MDNFFSTRWETLRWASKKIRRYITCAICRAGSIFLIKTYLRHREVLGNRLQVKRNRHCRFRDFAKTRENTSVGLELAESQKGLGGSFFRSPTHLYHHRRCFITFPQARQLCNTSNFRQKALDPGSESSRRTQKIKKSKIAKTIQTRSRMHSYGQS